MAKEVIYHCFMGVTSITRAHVHDTFITQTFEEKILYSFKLNIFYEKSFQIYMISKLNKNKAKWVKMKCLDKYCLLFPDWKNSSSFFPL